MGREAFKAVVIMALVISLAGCGTVLNLMPESHALPKGSGEKGIYGGVVFDVDTVSAAEWPWEKLVGIFMLLFIDLPLSVVLDTATLPITIPVTLSR